MKVAIMVLTGVLVMRSAPAPAAIADTFAVFAASVTFPVMFQTTDAHGNQVIATKTLKTPDVVNLALGRSLATKLNKATETLAFASDVSTPGAGSMLVVFNPTLQTIVATVFTTSNFVLLSNQDFSKNAAFSDVTIQTTVDGDPVHNRFQTTTLAMAGTGKSAGSFSATSMGGPITITITDASNVTTTIDGLVVKGKLKASGKQLAQLGVM
jgi:hypothetical protein